MEHDLRNPSEKTNGGIDMKTSRILHFTSAASFAFILCACAPLEFEEYPDEAGGKPTNAVETMAAGEENALAVETQLMLGTFLLEGTDLAVDAEQAAVLLPLWQEWHDLLRDNTVAPGDREELLERIQSAMTAEQIAAIAAMELTQADLSAFMQEYLPTPEGGFPGFNQTQTLSPDEMATLQSVYRGYIGGARGPDSMLLHALIGFLESKIPT
jgi:hypothetical protein